MLKILVPFMFAIGVSGCVDDDVEQDPLPEDGETLTTDDQLDLDTVADPRGGDEVLDDDIRDGFEDVFELVPGIDDPARPGCGNLRTSDDDGKTDNPCGPQL